MVNNEERVKTEKNDTVRFSVPITSLYKVIFFLQSGAAERSKYETQQKQSGECYKVADI